MMYVLRTYTSCTYIAYLMSIDNHLTVHKVRYYIDYYIVDSNKLMILVSKSNESLLFKCIEDFINHLKKKTRVHFCSRL